MPDSQFDILIKFGLSKEKAGEAVAELKKVGAEGVKQEKEVKDATDKTFTSKKQLKDMVHQLGNEFPLLGQVGRLALNPIAFTTAAITGAFVIWNTRVKELTRSLGGIEMPDVSTSTTERINQQAAAVGQLAKNMTALADASGRIKANYETSLQTIKGNEELLKAMGFDPGQTGDKARVAAATEKAIALDAQGRSRIAAAGTPGSVEKEAALRSKYDQTIASGDAEKRDAEERLKGLQDLGDASILNPMTWYRGGRAIARYGFSGGLEGAMNSERGIIASQQGVIDSGARFASSTGVRAVRRSEIAGGLENIKDANAMDPVVVGLLQQIAANTAGKAPYPDGGVPNPGANIGEFAAAITQISRFAINLPAVIKQIESANIALERMNQRQANESQRP